MASIVLIKPDAIQQEMLGLLISRFERYEIDAICLRQMHANMCAEHYAEHVGKPFYSGLVTAMCSGPTCALALKGDVRDIRSEAMKIRINWRYLVNGPRNLVHASDSEEAARRECVIWFSPR